MAHPYHWAGAAAAVTAVGGYLSGELSVGVALQTVTTALVGIFIRDGISKEHAR